VTERDRQLAGLSQHEPYSGPVSQQIRTGSHDLPVSAALAAFMGKDWALPEAAEGPNESTTGAGTAGLHPAARFTHERRAALSRRFPGERLVIPSGQLVTRSNDTDYRFRPHSAFVHLTAAQEPEWCLVLDPVTTSPAPGMPTHTATLFVRENAPRSEGSFFRDRRYGEFWVGPSPTVAQARSRFGVESRSADELADHLRADVAGDGRPAVPVRLLRGVDPVVDALLRTDATPPVPDGAQTSRQAQETQAERDAALESALSELRLVKDAWEVAELQHAVDVTARGFEDVVRALPQALDSDRGERWVEGVFGLRARVEGNGVGYETIAASGAHACVLHWIRNDGRLRSGDLLLLDAGVEVDSLHTADVTRTLPISGRFSPAQRKVYELVYAAQEAGIAAVKPGARFRDFHSAAMAVIAAGLEEWGVLGISAQESLRPDSGLHRRYTLCSSGHMLGLDVHDCAKARAETYLDGVLQVGHVLTVEPGLYFQPDDLTIPAELRGIGVRIEDDVVVTADGCRVLSEALPRSADAVEAWMRSLIDG